MSDSAGVPWAGRRFEHSAGSDDDGSAPEALIDALRRFRAGEVGEAVVVDAVRESRLLVPLVARQGEAAADLPGGATHTDAELSIVTVAGPDGRSVMPVFSSVDAMRRWNPQARPVPADAVRVAVAAAGDGTELVVLDPTSETEFVIRRPALWAIGQSLPWLPSYLDDELVGEFRACAEDEPAVRSVTLSPGDAKARLAGPELVVHLDLAPGLVRIELDALLERLRARWAASETIAGRTDSLRVTLGTSGA